MNDIHNINLRFNLENTEDRQAWAYLHTMDKHIFKSYSKTVIRAVNEFFDRYYKSEADPYFETRERENEFINQIAETVIKRLKAVLQTNEVFGKLENSNEKSVVEKDNEDIDWDFIGQG